MPDILSVEFIRDGLRETLHCGAICHLGRQGIVFETGDCTENKYFLRSCMKPLQMTIINDFQLDRYFNFSLPEIAAATSSHCGEELHISLVRSILQKSGRTEDDLLCPVELPLSERAQKELIQKRLPASKIHSNCSGKHAMMLAACTKEGYDIKTYDSFSHPLQQHIKKRIAELTSLRENDLPASLDGCGLPVYAMSLRNLAKSYLSLFGNTNYMLLQEAFIEYPYIIGGEGRLDSEIINASGGKLIAKVGAGGLIVIFNLIKLEAVAVKIDDASMKARAIAAVEYLRKIGWLASENIENSGLAILADKTIKTLDNRVVGQAVCSFLF